jgi:aryl-alcohol dehydrogenase-like predicted oxidoreductase
MRRRSPAELIVGSVQLGLAYGAANRTEKPSRETALRLIKRAADAGITAFDTARAYGDSEERLGEALNGRRVRTITKLSPLAELKPDAPRAAVRAAVEASVGKPLSALKRQNLDCLLLHCAAHLTALDGATWHVLQTYLAAETIGSLGVSVQSPAEARALAAPQAQHLQLAFNLLDWRWHEAGVVDAIRDRTSLSVHARSVFLQGILAAGDAGVWHCLPQVDAPALLAWTDRSARAFGRANAADLCLAYVRGQDWIDGVVVGMETVRRRPSLAPQDCAALEASRPRVPEPLLDPAPWPPMAALDLFRLDGRIAFISGAAAHLGRGDGPCPGRGGSPPPPQSQERCAPSGVRKQTRHSRKSGAECAAFDMMDFPAVRRFFAGRSLIDVLINNAVTMTPKSFKLAAQDDFDQTYPSSVTAAFEAARAAQPALARAAKRRRDPRPRSLPCIFVVQLRHRNGAGSGRRLDGLVV